MKFLDTVIVAKKISKNPTMKDFCSVTILLTLKSSCQISNDASKFCDHNPGYHTSTPATVPPSNTKHRVHDDVMLSQSIH